MNRFVILFLVVLLSALPCPAQATSEIQTNTAAQATTATNPAADKLNIPEETVLLAKLTTNLIPSQCRPGDPVQAQITQDVKHGKEVLLKKGSTLLGVVSLVQTATAEKPETLIGIVFDSVKVQKTEHQFPLHLIIQAVAPESDIDTNNSLADGSGTGLTTATRSASVSGHASTIKGSVNALSTESKGVYDFVGVRLGDRVTSTGHATVLAFSNANVLLKKGAQLVMRVVDR